MDTALVLIGAPGTGKSSVLEALTTLLEIDGVEYGAIESEQLAWGSPLLAAADWMPQLAAVAAIQARAGRRLLLVAATTENGQELGEVIDAIGAKRALVVCLTAPADALAERIETREPDAWPGKRRLIDHARALAQSIPDLDRIDITIETGSRTAEDIATEVFKALRQERLIDP